MAFRNFQPNSAGFQQLGVSAGMRKVLASVATEGKAIAEGLSQDFRTDREHPHYADQFEVRDTTISWRGQYPGDRAAAVLANTSNHAIEVELGTKRSPKAHHILARTLDQMADR